MTHTFFIFFAILYCFIIIYFGIHIINMDPKSALNRLFLLLYISLSFGLWFAMANSPNMDTCLFGVTAIGWATVYSLLYIFSYYLRIISLLKQFSFHYIYTCNYILYAFSFSNKLHPLNLIL